MSASEEPRSPAKAAGRSGSRSHPRARVGAQRRASLRAERDQARQALEQALRERDRAREALEEAVRERDRAEAVLREADRHKDEFLATLAHELRNPLAPIRSAMQIMRMAEGDHATATAARAMIERQLKHLVRLIDDLMDVSRLTQGKLELRKERVDLAAVLQIAFETNRPLLESKQHRLRIELPPHPLYVEADTTRLAQVFSNLLNNSAKFSDAHGTISIHAARQGRHAVVTVSDCGIGIEPAMLPRVFDMFTQVARGRSASHDGLGIGLTLVRRLVELHGGTVSAHSEGSGKGSAFTVRLDLLEGAGVDCTLAPPSAGGGASQPRGRVLIADDNFDAAQSLALILRMEGHEVRTAGDGLEALEIAEGFQPQIVLLDIGMPKLDGYETARRLRERPWAASALLVAQTGWGQEDDKRRAREAGFDRHLVKPLDPEALSDLLEEALESLAD